MENTNVTSKVLAIVAIITGSIGLIISFIPVLGILAIILGAIGIILSIIAILVKSQNKILVLAAVIISLFSIIFGYWQYADLKEKSSDTIDSLKQEINQMESLDSLDSGQSEMEMRLDSLE